MRKERLLLAAIAGLAMSPMEKASAQAPQWGNQSSGGQNGGAQWGSQSIERPFSAPQGNSRGGGWNNGNGGGYGYNNGYNSGGNLIQNGGNLIGRGGNLNSGRGGYGYDQGGYGYGQGSVTVRGSVRITGRAQQQYRQEAPQSPCNPGDVVVGQIADGRAICRPYQAPLTPRPVEIQQSPVVIAQTKTETVCPPAGWETVTSSKFGAPTTELGGAPFAQGDTPEARLKDSLSKDNIELAVDLMIKNGDLPAEVRGDIVAEAKEALKEGRYEKVKQVDLLGFTYKHKKGTKNAGQGAYVGNESTGVKLNFAEEKRALVIEKNLPVNGKMQHIKIYVFEDCGNWGLRRQVSKEVDCYTTTSTVPVGAQVVEKAFVAPRDVRVDIQQLGNFNDVSRALKDVGDPTTEDILNDARPGTRLMSNYSRLSKTEQALVDRIQEVANVDIRALVSESEYDTLPLRAAIERVVKEQSARITY